MYLVITSNDYISRAMDRHTATRRSKFSIKKFVKKDNVPLRRSIRTSNSENVQTIILQNIKVTRLLEKQQREIDELKSIVVKLADELTAKVSHISTLKTCLHLPVITKSFSNQDSLFFPSKPIQSSDKSLSFQHITKHILIITKPHVHL